MTEHEHSFMIVERKWQTVNVLRYQILNHSEQAAVCSCGFVVNPWRTEDQTNSDKGEQG